MTFDERQLISRFMVVAGSSFDGPALAFFGIVINLDLYEQGVHRDAAKEIAKHEHGLEDPCWVCDDSDEAWQFFSQTVWGDACIYRITQKTIYEKQASVKTRSKL